MWRQVTRSPWFDSFYVMWRTRSRLLWVVFGTSDQKQMFNPSPLRGIYSKNPTLGFYQAKLQDHGKGRWGGGGASLPSLRNFISGPCLSPLWNDEDVLNLALWPGKEILQPKTAKIANRLVEPLIRSLPSALRMPHWVGGVAGGGDSASAFALCLFFALVLDKALPPGASQRQEEVLTDRHSPRVITERSGAMFQLVFTSARSDSVQNKARVFVLGVCGDLCIASKQCLISE